MTKAASRITFVFKAPVRDNTAGAFHSHTQTHWWCVHFHVYSNIINTFHIPLQHIPFLTNTCTHTQTAQASRGVEKRMRWEKELSFMCDVRTSLSVSSCGLRGGWLVCSHHTGNNSRSSEDLLLVSSTNTNWHLVVPPACSWCACVCAWASRQSPCLCACLFRA